MSLCRICRGPTWGMLCDRCFAQRYPEASARHLDTQHARTIQQAADRYEQAREADEGALRPPESISPADLRDEDR